MGRLARVEAMGAHSFDGSQFSRWPQKVRRYTHMGIALSEGQ
jgi:hypothetical protein